MTRQPTRRRIRRAAGTVGRPTHAQHLPAGVFDVRSEPSTRPPPVLGEGTKPMSAKQTSRGGERRDAEELQRDGEGAAGGDAAGRRPIRGGHSGRPNRTAGHAGARRRIDAARRFAGRAGEHRAEIAGGGRIGDAGREICRRSAAAVASRRTAALGDDADGAGVADAASAAEHGRGEADRHLAGPTGGGASRAAEESGPSCERWNRGRGRRGRGRGRYRHAGDAGRLAEPGGGHDAGSRAARVGNGNGNGDTRRRPRPRQ